MELEHTFTVPVPPGDAFAVLRDIERIGPCMPGATIESVDGEDFTGSVKVKIGPIKVTYTGEASYTDVDEEALTATIDARGKEARGSGTANAKVHARLAEVEGGSEVTVVTDLAITGRPAQFGRGVLEDVGGKLIQQFAECLAHELSGGEEPVAEEAPAADDAVGDGEAQAAVTAPTTAPQRPKADAIDLLDVAGAPVAKRLAPVAAGALLLLLIAWLLRRRS